MDENGQAGRQSAIRAAEAGFDSGAFRETLAARVAVPTVSVDPAHNADLYAYLTDHMVPAVEALGASAEIFDNPDIDRSPFLVAKRVEDPALPTLLTYGHGDVVPGLEDQWSAGRSPWALEQAGERWYGRGTADNKMQHSLILDALGRVLAERGRLGFNATILIEMGEEGGSPGLETFLTQHRDLLAADLLLASDGPRKDRSKAELSLGNRGSVGFDLIVDLREGGGRHSGHWGGVLTDPGLRLAHALASITTPEGRILVADWIPEEIPPRVRDLFRAMDFNPGADGPEIDPHWGEPGLTPVEKAMGFTSFIVLAMLCGTPERPVNGVQARARARCQIRYTADMDRDRLVPALRKHLDRRGFHDVKIEFAGSSFAASRTDPDNPWVGFAARSMTETLGHAPNVVPNASGSLPSEIFQRVLGVPTLWVPHSYTGCQQHGPDEHVLEPLIREGLALMTGLFWDLGAPEKRPSAG